MDQTKFNIFGVVKQAYSFLFKEWRYLLKVGTIPLLMQIMSSIFVQFEKEGASIIETYLWSFPATVFMAWFVFIEMRFLLLGERLEETGKDKVFFLQRTRSMKAAVILYVLFSMGVSSILYFFFSLSEGGQINIEGPLALFLFLSLIFIVWAIRFSVLPIVASVNYPVRVFLKKVKGFLFSFRLLVMGFCCIFPIAFAFQIILGVLIEMPEEINDAMTLATRDKVVLMVLTSCMSLLVTIILNAAAAFALKEILSGDVTRSGKRR